MKRTMTVFLCLLLVFFGCSTKSPAAKTSSGNQVEVGKPGNVEEKKDEEKTQVAEAPTQTDVKSAEDPSPHQGERTPEESKERIEKLKGTVEAFIKSESYNFTFDDELEFFWGDFTLENNMKQCRVFVFLYEDMVAVRTEPIEWSVPEAARDQVAIFTTRYNNDSSYSYLMMDYRDGYIYSRCAQVVENVLPGQEEIATIFYMSLDSFTEAGDALLAISNDGMDPHKAYQEILDADEKKKEKKQE